MSDYRVVHQRQDVGFRISSLYRQQQLAVGLLDLSSKEDLVESLRWYSENMSIPLYVITLQSRMEEDDWASRFPDANFIVFKQSATTGEYINAFADECYASYFLVVRTDSSLIAFEGEKLMAAMAEKKYTFLVQYDALLMTIISSIDAKSVI